MNRTPKILILIILILIGTNVYTIYRYYDVFRSLGLARQLLSTRALNSSVLNFTKLLIDKVLGAQKEISFEDRLRLENAVRSLNDPVILEQWNVFVQSKTQDEAQSSLRKLLVALVSKIKAE